MALTNRGENSRADRDAVTAHACNADRKAFVGLWVVWGMGGDLPIYIVNNFKFTVFLSAKVNK